LPIIWQAWHGHVVAARMSRRRRWNATNVSRNQSPTSTSVRAVVQQSASPSTWSMLSLPPKLLAMFSMSSARISRECSCSVPDTNAV